MAISSDFRNMFINSDAQTLKTAINTLSTENKGNFLHAAREVFDEYAIDYKNTGDEGIKNKYFNLLTKFKEIFPQDSGNIADIDNFAQIIFNKRQIKPDTIKANSVTKSDITDKKNDEFLTLLGKIVDQLKDPALPPTQIQEAVESVLKFVNSNLEVFQHDPSLATRGHQILHDLAQKEIALGNFQNAFIIEAKAVEAFPLPTTHVLHHMDQAILDGAAKQYDPSMGAHFSSLDSSIVKGGNLHATQRKIDGKLVNSVDFKISHYARDELTNHLNAITTHLDAFKASLPSGLCSDVKVNQGVPHIYKLYDNVAGEFSSSKGYQPDPSLCKATEIIFEGVGKIIIGNNKEVGCMYNWIQVEMDPNLPPGVGAQKLQQILAVTGLGPVLGQQPPESDERMKIAQLCRAFHPVVCTALDVSKDFYYLPIEDLKKEIIKKAPGMQQILKHYLEDNPNLMVKLEIMPGKEIWGVQDLGTLMKKNGAWGLMTGVGNSGGWESAKTAIVRLLSQGAMSTEQRAQSGLSKPGASSREDLCSGGGDQVFTRLINANVSSIKIQDFNFQGNAQILWNVETVAQRVPYACYDDRFGAKNRFEFRYDYFYKVRPDMQEFSRNCAKDNNEVMVKNCLDPSHISGIAVQYPDNKQDLIEHLIKNHLAEKKPNGEIVITFKGRSINANDFIHVGNEFKKEWWG